MKPRLFTSILMFISAYSPLFLIFAVRDFDFECKHQLRHPLAISILLGLTLISIVILFLSLKFIKSGSMAVKLTSVKNRSVDLINYSILYVICFFNVDFSKPSDTISMSIFLVLMLVLTITTKSIFLNPVLSIAGYGLYDLEYEFDGKSSDTVALSKIELNTGDIYYIRNISRFLYLIKKKKQN